MLSLFDEITAVPDGFAYYADFITVQEEAELIDLVSSLDLHPLVFQGFVAKRRVESYGYDYNFDRRTVKEGKPIPEGFRLVINRIAEHLLLQPEELAEVLVTEYPVGSVINWHRDAPPFDIVIGLSLLSDCQFQFRPYDKVLQTRASIITLPVKRRSLYIMQGEAREQWEHRTKPVDEVRFSITFRTLR